jgi:AraC-like DNA-binding protein
MQAWTTLDRPAAEQYPYWREVLCEQFTALDPVATRRDGFESTVALKPVLDVTVSHIASKQQTIVRGIHEIRRAPNEYFFTNLQLKGTCVARQDGREALIRPGDFYIVDTTRVYELAFDDWEVICLRLPRHRLAPLLRDPLESTVVPLCDDGALGTIAGSFIRDLFRCPEAIPLSAQQGLVETLVNLLAIALGASTETREVHRSDVRRGLRDAITRYVADNASSPGLSASQVAGRFRISTRYLHKLFEDSAQSFAHLVLERRLDRCASAIASPAQDGRSISQIAFTAGFGDISTFCKAFQRRYGMSASEFRRDRDRR